ncbi:MAG: VWA domain-containing protein [Pseudomonadota bacterium]
MSDSRQISVESQDNALASFLEDVAKTPLVRAKDQPGRIIFALDATMSRAPTWAAARVVQGDMFAAAQTIGGLEVQVVFFRGQSEFRKSQWTPSAARLADKMSKVRCHGGLTQIERVLKHGQREAQIKDVQAMIYVGDAVEENADRLGDAAAQLALCNVKLFAFQEGKDERVEAIFRDLARITGGAYARFDASSVATLKALLRAVGVFASGGLGALKALSRSDPSASRLLEQLPNAGQDHA